MWVDICVVCVNLLCVAYVIYCIVPKCDLFYTTYVKLRLCFSIVYVGFPSSYVTALINHPEVVPSIASMECVTRDLMKCASERMLTSRDLCPHQMLRRFMETDPVFSTALSGNCLSSFGRSVSDHQRIRVAEKIHGQPLGDAAQRFVSANSVVCGPSQQAVTSWRDNPMPGSCAMSTLFSTQLLGAPRMSQVMEILWNSVLCFGAYYACVCKLCSYILFVVIIGL